MTLTRALFALLFAFPLAARADWTGKLHIHTEPPGPHGESDQDGRVFGQGMKLRIEMDGGPMGKMDVIADLKAHTSTMIIEQRKAYMTMSGEQMKGRGMLADVRCDSDDMATCLKKGGFTKTGSETVNGKKTDRWEADTTGPRGVPTHETLWLVHGVKGPELVKQQSKSAQRTTTIDVTQIEEKAQPDSLFAAPAGYLDMSSQMGGRMGPPGGMGGGAPGGPR